jgi:hypothetical protein
MILVETLVLLATTRSCREAMRVRGVYEVIKTAHLAETTSNVRSDFPILACDSLIQRRKLHSQVTEPMVRLVNLLMRDEGPDTAIEELETPSEPTKSAAIDASGHTTPATTIQPPPPVTAPAAMEEEDEEEMLIEV